MKRTLQIAFVVLAVIAPIRAQSATQRPLRGLRGVAVKVYVERHGNMPGRLNEDGLQTATELQLRRAGLNVAKSSDAPNIAPRLLVAINAVEENGNFIYSVIVSLIEPATVERNQERIAATIWQSDMLASAADSNTVRQTVGDQIDIFINDWLASNPRQ